MNVRIGKKYELRKADEMNLRLYIFEETQIYDKPRNQGGKPTGEMRMEWKGKDAYFPDIASGLIYIYKHMQRNEPGREDVFSTIKRMNEIYGNLLDAIEDLK